MSRVFLFVIAVWFFSVPAHAGSVGNCVTKEMQIANITHRFPDSTAHAMSDEQYMAFAKAKRIPSGDSAIWFEREAYRSAFIVIFKAMCRVGSGQVDKVDLPGLMTGPRA